MLDRDGRAGRRRLREQRPSQRVDQGGLQRRADAAAAVDQVGRTALPEFGPHLLGHDHADVVLVAESAEDVVTMEQVLRKAGKEVTFYTYPSTRHWFFEENRPGYYDASAANLAWQRTLAFLHSHLTHD